MKRHGLQQFIMCRSPALGLESWCHCLPALGNQELRSTGVPVCTFEHFGLVGPGLAAPKCKVIGIGCWPTYCLFGLNDLIRNALALAVGDRLFLGVKLDRELLFHIARAGPAHQRLDSARLLGLVIELPFLGLRSTRLHRVFGGLKYACSHGSGPVINAASRRVVEAANIV